MAQTKKSQNTENTSNVEKIKKSTKENIKIKMKTNYIGINGAFYKNEIHILPYELAQEFIKNNEAEKC